MFTPAQLEAFLLSETSVGNAREMSEALVKIFTRVPTILRDKRRVADYLDSFPSFIEKEDAENTANWIMLNK